MEHISGDSSGSRQDQLVEDAITGEVYSSERSADVDSILVTDGKWRVRQLVFDWPEKLRWLWDTMSAHKSLFSDLTRGDESNFIALLSDPNSFWLEVLNAADETVGIIYLQNLDSVVDAEVHINFFDRDVIGKVDLCKAVMQWVFARFPFNRLTAIVPEKYFAAKRMAEFVGFTHEGRRRESILMNGEWWDEIMFGILRREVATWAARPRK